MKSKEKTRKNRKNAKFHPAGKKQCAGVAICCNITLNAAESL